MKKNLNSKIALIVAVLAICVYGIFGVPSGVTGKDLGDAMTKRIHLGLDLRGGAHLILQVEVLEAVNAETDNTVALLKENLKTANLSYSQVYKPDPAKPTLIKIEGTAPSSVSDVRSLLESKDGNEYDVASGDTDSSFTLVMKPMILTALEKKTDQQAIEAIRDRVDALGVSEPQIQEYGLGDNQILVDLPGVENESQIESIIQGTNRLEIHAVVGGPYKDEQEAAASLGGSVPADQMLKSFSGVVEGGSSVQSVYVLQRASVVAGNDFRSADPSVNSNTGQREVQFTLTNEAGDKFYDYTSKNVGRSMAVVMNDHIREVATIQSAIRDRGEITGSFTSDEVASLSKLLRTGALPASLQQLEKRFVGASLGADSIRQGITAAIVGVLVVMVFMLVYYRGSGINADVALILNLVILLGFMGAFSATLTLPGIAGVILTIGMGVDSNVLIFERIREEVRAGKAPSAAVDQGFAHAWVTIVDTHVTTIVSAAILFLFGTGPVKGFATTLTVGLLANLFTAVFVSRVIFDAHLNKLKPGERVSI
ncbi:MAG TPA: protein translocase subunit SecD [Terracidiphilus sp.]|jgi:preprotein translocase subunit SecD|nr:protein translocase subunit SecD [Terracidiphilus sp.]